MGNKPVSDAPHIPVLLAEVLESLRVANLPNGVFIDGTLGAGGHTAAILAAAPDTHVLGFDRDPRSLAVAQARLDSYAARVQFIHGSYDTMFACAAEHHIAAVDGILLDIGISSMHVDDVSRGFSFRQDAPLDMRFDVLNTHQSAADLVNTCTADELADIFYKYGEEHDSRRLARAVIAARPLHTTRQLAAVIESHTHPKARSDTLARIFQALRIAVNDELGMLERVLPQAIKLLKPTGRLAVISFHSLEDRIVKDYFKLEATDCICPPKQLVCTCGHRASIRLVTRKPITPSQAEIAANPRSRSAKLRVAEKI
ncbi:MAG: 16S rRNA (cytosine(1402)-N(4))-methyltransferase RsmH [Anaerolineae bacterium]